MNHLVLRSVTVHNIRVFGDRLVTTTPEIDHVKGFEIIRENPRSKKRGPKRNSGQNLTVK